MATQPILVEVGQIVNLTTDVPLVIGVSYYVSSAGVMEIAEVDTGDVFPARGHRLPVEIESKVGSTIQVRGIERLAHVVLTETEVA